MFVLFVLATTFPPLRSGAALLSCAVTLSCLVVFSLVLVKNYSGLNPL